MPFVIDIDPVAFTLFGIEVRWYGIVIAVAAAVAIWLARREAGRRGIAPEMVADAAIWVGAAALVGGRALYVIQNELGTLAADPAHVVMVWMGGLSFYGALIGALLVLAAFARRHGIRFLTILDVAAPSAAIGQAIGHLGCLIGGDSYGIPTSLPWAVVYQNPNAMAPLGVPLHPTQAYEAILLAALFAGLWLGRHRLARLGDGAVASAYLLALAAIRFGLFYLRDEPSVLLGLKTAQLIGLAIAGLAVVLFVASRRAHARSMRRTAHAAPGHPSRRIGPNGTSSKRACRATMWPTERYGRMDAIASQTRSTPRRRVRIDRDRWVSIRPIERTDAAGLSDFYAHLSPESQRRRFLSCGNRSGHDLARAFTERDGEGFVGILDQPGPNDGAVVAHASVQPDGHGGAEIAGAVADEFQRHGIGTALMEMVVQHARRLGLRPLTATLFADNTPMRRLLRGAGCEIASDQIDAGIEEIALAI